jgi:hypothetical protein
MWAGCSLLRAEGVFFSLDVLYGGLGISKLNFLIKKYKFYFFSYNFLSSEPWIRIYLTIWIRSRIRIETNADPQHCLGLWLLFKLLIFFHNLLFLCLLCSTWLYRHWAAWAWPSRSGTDRRPRPRLAASTRYVTYLLLFEQRIQIATLRNFVRLRRIRMFFGLLDPYPYPLVWGTDHAPDPAQDPPLIEKK